MNTNALLDYTKTPLFWMVSRRVIMPAKSKAQFKKMFVLQKEGKISKSELKDFTHDVKYKKLPKKVKKAKK
jgi:hypothetical protein